MPPPIDRFDSGIDLSIARTHRALPVEERWGHHERNRRAFDTLATQPDGSTFVEVLCDLAATGAEFVVVGEVATQLQGGRATRFLLELVGARSRSNAEQILEALCSHRPVVRGTGTLAPTTPEDLLESAAVHLMTDAGAVDLELTATTYQTLRATASTVQIGGRAVHVANRLDLSTFSVREEDPYSRYA